MKWKDPRKELPPLDKSYRCLAQISVYKESRHTTWTGYCDVYFTADHGWRICETEEMVCVKKWILIEELENEIRD